MPARAVPFTSKDQRLAVWNSWRSRAMVSFMYAVNSGSN